MPESRCLFVPMAASNMEFKRLQLIRECLCPGWWCCQELLMVVTAFLLLHETVLSLRLVVYV